MWFLRHFRTLNSPVNSFLIYCSIIIDYTYHPCIILFIAVATVMRIVPERTLILIVRKYLAIYIYVYLFFWHVMCVHTIIILIIVPFYLLSNMRQHPFCIDTNMACFKCQIINYIRIYFKVKNNAIIEREIHSQLFSDVNGNGRCSFETILRTNVGR